MSVHIVDEPSLPSEGEVRDAQPARTLPPYANPPLRRGGYGARERSALQRAMSRVAWFVLGGIPTAILITAFLLQPDPLGHGTHQQLGLPPCGFLTVTGYPCPGCGLTTAFTHLVRFEIFGAVRANPFGVPLFLVSLVGVPVSVVGFVKSLPVVDTLERLSFDRVLLMLSFASILAWVGKLAGLLSG